MTACDAFRLFSSVASGSGQAGRRTIYLRAALCLPMKPGLPRTPTSAIDGKASNTSNPPALPSWLSHKSMRCKAAHWPRYPPVSAASAASTAALLNHQAAANQTFGKKSSWLIKSSSCAPNQRSDRIEPVRVQDQTLQPAHSGNRRRPSISRRRPALKLGADRQTGLTGEARPGFPALRRHVNDCRTPQASSAARNQTPSKAAPPAHYCGGVKDIGDRLNRAPVTTGRVCQRYPGQTHNATRGHPKLSRRALTWRCPAPSGTAAQPEPRCPRRRSRLRTSPAPVGAAAVQR
jgi:hypothetical protein